MSFRQTILKHGVMEEWNIGKKIEKLLFHYSITPIFQITIAHKKQIIC